MPADRNCFINSRRFAAFQQSETQSRSVIVNIHAGTQSAAAMPHPEGMCWAYCCRWVLKIKSNKRYLLEDFAAEQLIATDVQQDLRWRFPHSGTSNAILLHLGTTVDMGIVMDFLGTNDDIRRCLDLYVRDGANFLMLTLNGFHWAHAIALKLDQSRTGGRLNWSYPCAMFDPNVAQGMYNKHSDIANDLFAIIAAYGPTNVQAQLVCFPTGEVD